MMPTLTVQRERTFIGDCVCVFASFAPSDLNMCVGWQPNSTKPGSCVSFQPLSLFTIPKLMVAMHWQWAPHAGSQWAMSHRGLQVPPTEVLTLSTFLLFLLQASRCTVITQPLCCRPLPGCKTTLFAIPPAQYFLARGSRSLFSRSLHGILCDCAALRQMAGFQTEKRINRRGWSTNDALLKHFKPLNMFSVSEGSTKCTKILGLEV